RLLLAHEPAPAHAHADQQQDEQGRRSWCSPSQAFHGIQQQPDAIPSADSAPDRGQRHGRAAPGRLGRVLQAPRGHRPPAAGRGQQGDDGRPAGGHRGDAGRGARGRLPGHLLLGGAGAGALMRRPLWCCALRNSLKRRA
ncbi:unnamed protein product, partial [Heterosigma akashiwo]